MSGRRLRSPILKWVINAGPDDPVLNLWLLLGPFLITLVAVVGRNTVTTLLVRGYITAFVIHSVYNVLTSPERFNRVSHP